MIDWDAAKEFVDRKVKEVAAAIVCPSELTYSAWTRNYPPRVVVYFGVREYDGRKREALTHLGPVVAQPTDDELRVMAQIAVDVAEETGLRCRRSYHDIQRGLTEYTLKPDYMKFKCP